MSQSRQKLNGYSIGKLVFAGFYFLLASFLIIYFRAKIFNTEVDINRYDIYYRLIWCCSFGLFGFVALIITIINNVLYRNRKQDMSPFPTYLLYYPLLILITSAVSFALFSLILNLLGVLFYALSAALSFLLGYEVDDFINSLKWLFEKIISVTKK
jgi:hypothetical protein